jgi:aminoglycoside phosphotransferase (APT) family kinase protein
MTTDLSTLPPAIGQSLRAAFGDSPVLDLAPLHGGLSGATRFTCTVDGAAYVVRMGDLARAPREVACQRIAADLGVAPRIRYADPETGVCIMERIDGHQLGGPPDPRRLEKVCRALRRLHEGPAFPSATKPVDVIAFFAARLAELGDELPPDLARAVDDASRATARWAESAPCHEDLNPNNILETEDGVVFVDWEVAGAGDPFVDLAQLGVFAFARPDDRARILPTYLGRAPTEEEEARALLARVIAMSVYAAAFFHVRIVAGLPKDHGPDVPLGELLATIATSREKTHPGRIGGALLLEVRRALASEAYAAARARLLAA